MTTAQDTSDDKSARLGHFLYLIFYSAHSQCDIHPYVCTSIARRIPNALRRDMVRPHNWVDAPNRPEASGYVLIMAYRSREMDGWTSMACTIAELELHN